MPPTLCHPSMSQFRVTEPNTSSSRQPIRMLAQTLCSPAGATRALARSSRPAHSRGGTITASRARHEPPTAPGVQRAPAAAVAAARPRRELHRRRVPTAAGGQGGSLDEDEARERRFVRALLLAYFASQNRSLFAGASVRVPSGRVACCRSPACPSSNSFKLPRVCSSSPTVASLRLLAPPSYSQVHG